MKKQPDHGIFLSFTLTCLAVTLTLVDPPGAVAQTTGSDEIHQQLLQIRTRMAEVANRLGSSEVDRSQVVRQRRIADELALLVQRFSASEQSGRPEESARDSGGSTQSGKAEGEGQASDEANPNSGDAAVQEPELAEKQLVLDAWGEMPGELRDERGTGISPRFLPGYEQLIREYYRRMAK